MKFAYFNPTVIAVDDVPADVYTYLKDMVDRAHQMREHNDAGDPTISIRGGQQIQLLPNNFGLEVEVLKQFVELRCREYIDNLMKQNGRSDLNPYNPVMVSAWTIQQRSGDYQALHTHEAHLSGNIYIDVPDLDFESEASDASIEFRFPVIRNPASFIFVDQWRFKPQPLKMIVFPSYLPHTVYPWNGEGHRTILAWDAKLIPKDG
jgi:hypothetical protein